MDGNATETNVSLNTSEQGVMNNCSEFYEFADGISNTSIWVETIVTPVFLLIGIPGNILTLMVIFRQRKNITSTAVFLFMLAVSDTVFLVIGTLIDWLSIVTDYHIRAANIVVCKLFEFLYITSAQYSSWLLLVITIERIISITVPHAYNRICSPFRSKLSGLVILIILVMLNSHFFYGLWNPDEDEGPFGSKCGPIAEEWYQTLWFDYWPWVDLTLYFAVPFVVLVVGNAIILFKLIQMNRENKNKNTNRRSTSSITLLIVGLNVVFLVSATPFSLFMANETSIYGWRDEVMCTDLAEYEYRDRVVDVTVSVTLVLSYMNPSVNFILYVLSGTKFRNEVKALLFCRALGKENVFAQ